ncbi:hypothetical protein FOZ61_009541 [Perkinsus olseni]|uniref:C2H2-type domain-containing protein n=1 Tax=Perkinsus olseni TaxID=32597 RepID=A0A7J6M697_PEROL|nr:hypothetical protein FOZ61_009541 [Perkinsus olseni]
MSDLSPDRERPGSGPLKPLNVLLCLTGSVATIKWVSLIQELTEQGAAVNLQVNIKVVASDRALHFMYLDSKTSDAEVYTDAKEWDAWQGRGDPVTHIELRRWADVALIAPLSANTLAKIANGIADNLLTSVVRCLDLSSEGLRKCPVYLCPAMNTMMWDNPFTREHLKVCVSTMGFRLIMPISKTLVCGDTGLGAMAEPRDIAAAVLTDFDLVEIYFYVPFVGIEPVREWQPGVQPAVMGRKNKHSEGGSKIFRPFCYYCERDFDDEKVLIQHQKIKHFKCSTCQRKLDTASGLVAHMLQVHRETLNKVPGAIKGRENPDLQIRGMENVPMGMILDKAKGSDMENFYMRKHMEQKHDALPPPPPRPAGGLPFMPGMFMHPPPPTQLLMGTPPPMPGAGPRGQTPPPGGMPGLGAPPTPPMPPFFMAHGGQPTCSSTNQPVTSQQQPAGLPQPPMGVPTPPPFPGFPSQPASTAAPGVVAAAAPMSFPAPLGMPPPSSSPPNQDDPSKQFGNQASSAAAAAAAAAAATAAARLQGAFSGRSRSRSRSPRRNYTTSDGTPSAGQGLRLVHGSGHLAGITLTSYQDDLQKGDQVCFEEMRALAMLSATG